MRKKIISFMLELPTKSEKRRKEMWNIPRSQKCKPNKSLRTIEPFYCVLESSTAKHVSLLQFTRSCNEQLRTSINRKQNTRTWKWT